MSLAHALALADLIRPERASEIIGISVRTLDRHVAAGEAPQPLIVGGRRLFDEEAIRAYALAYVRRQRRRKKRSPMSRAPEA